MTKIEWTHGLNGRVGRTWNPVVGCTIISPGCTNCYAMRMAARIERMQPASHYKGLTKQVNGNPVWTGKIARAPDKIFNAPLKWRKPTRVFVNSMSDLFHEDVPDKWIDRIFAIMALTPQHTYQLLSKRPARMKAYCSSPNTIERVAALVYGSKYGQGRSDNLTRSGGRDGNRRRGADMAGQEAPRETASEGRERLQQGRGVDGLSEGPGRISDPRRLFVDCDDDRRGENGDGRTPRGMGERQRANPCAIDDQSQKRGQTRQPASEFGTGNHVGTAPPRAGRSERMPPPATGQQAPKNAAHGSGCFANAVDAKERRDGEDNSGILQHECEGGFGYLHREDVAARLAWPLNNCWLGVSVEDQARADERIPLLLETPAAVRFISAEPLLSGLDLWHPETCGDCDPCYGGRPDQCAAGSYCVGLLGGIDWVIVGGESGPGKRPVDLAWMRSIRDQCLAAGVPLFVKQIDKRIPIPDDLMIRQWPKGVGQ